MNRKQFIELVKEAEKGSVYKDEVDLWEQLKPFDGLALHKERRMATKNSAISFIRYQALQMNGNWDWDELETLQYCFKRVDLI
jgi:hypothetical protein